MSLFPPIHGVPLPLHDRASIQKMTDTKLATFVRLVPRAVKALIRPPRAAPSVNTQVVPSPFEDGPASSSDSVVRRIAGKCVRIKRERAPCSPPTSIENGHVGVKKRGRPMKVDSDEAGDIPDNVRCALDLLDNRLAELARVIEAAVDKVADLSQQFVAHESILIQKGFF